MPADETKPIAVKTNKKPRYFYGWNIVGAAFMAQLAYAEHYASNMGLFLKPLQEEFGFSRSALAAIQTIARGTEAVSAPIIGPLVDRYGPRVLIPLGAIVSAVGSIMAARSGSIWQLYLARGIITAVGFSLMGALVVDVVISKWFVQKRGRATGTTRIGGNVSTFIMTPVTVFVIARYGWRQMFVVFAVFTLATALLPSAIFMRRRPEDMGLHPDGIEPGTDLSVSPSQEKSRSIHAGASQERTWTRREVVKTSAFWLLTTAYAVDALVVNGVNISMAPYIQDLGYGATIVAGVLTFRGGVMALVSPLSGFVAEHADKPIVRVIPFMLHWVSALSFLLARQPVFLWLAGGIYGAAVVSGGIIQSVVWANFFGRPSLGTIRSLGFLLTFGFGAIGPVVMNTVYDLMDSYRPAFFSIIALSAVSALLIWVVRPPKPQSPPS
ncbi:MAG: MFS transporter [Chloroflexota bacterium]